MNVLATVEINDASVSVRAPKVKDLRGLNADAGAEFAFEIAQKCCSLSPAEFNELDFHDGMKIVEVVSNYLEKK